MILSSATIHFYYLKCELKWAVVIGFILLSTNYSQKSPQFHLCRWELVVSKRIITFSGNLLMLSGCVWEQPYLYHFYSIMEVMEISTTKIQWIKECYFMKTRSGNMTYWHKEPENQSVPGPISKARNSLSRRECLSYKEDMIFLQNIRGFIQHC